MAERVSTYKPTLWGYLEDLSSLHYVTLNWYCCLYKFKSTRETLLTFSSHTIMQKLIYLEQNSCQLLPTRRFHHTRGATCVHSTHSQSQQSLRHVCTTHAWEGWHQDILTLPQIGIHAQLRRIDVANAIILFIQCYNICTRSSQLKLAHKVLVSHKAQSVWFIYSFPM